MRQTMNQNEKKERNRKQKKNNDISISNKKWTRKIDNKKKKDIKYFIMIL